MSAPPAETSHCYSAYGLSINSELPLPELLQRLRQDDETIDVWIRMGSLAALPDEASDIGEGHYSHGDSVWLSFPGACRICVSEGSEITVEGEPGVDCRVLRLLLLGVALGVLLHQRGFLALHASAVCMAGAAVAFLGAAGAGKSTMTAALRARGHAVVTDDILAVNFDDPARPTVYSGFPQLKLTSESAAALGHDISALNKIHATHPKYGCPVTEGVARDRLPLTRVYILAQSGELRLEELTPQASLMELVRNTYTLGLLAPSGTMPRHLRQCAAVVAAVRIRRLHRPFDLEALPGIAALLEEE